MKLWMLLFALIASPAWAAETVCDDGQDNDADSMMDCADKDCAQAPNCQPSGVAENSGALCSDWVDNDGNGQMDCDDVACFGAGISVCQGSFERKAGVPVRVTTSAPATAEAPAQQQPSSAPSRPICAPTTTTVSATTCSAQMGSIMTATAPWTARTTAAALTPP